MKRIWLVGGSKFGAFNAYKTTQFYFIHSYHGFHQQIAFKNTNELERGRRKEGIDVFDPVRRLLSKNRIQEAINIYNIIKKDKELKLPPTIISNLMKTLEKEKHYYKKSTKEYEWIDNQADLLLSDSFEHCFTMEHCINYVSIVDNFEQSFQLFQKILGKLGIYLDDPPEDTLQLFNDKLGASVNDVHLFIKALFKNCRNYVLDKQPKEEKRQWIDINKTIVLRDSKRPRYEIEAKIHGQLLPNIISIYSFYKEIMNIPRKRDRTSQEFDPDALVTSESLLQLLTYLAEITQIVRSKYVIGVVAADILEYNLIPYIKTSIMETILLACAQMHIPADLAFLIFERKREYCWKNQIEFNPKSNLYGLLITAHAQSGSPSTREKCIELLEEMRDKYKLNVSQSVFMAIAKLMIDEGLLNETYIFFESAKAYLEKKGLRITPGFWFQILSCCRLDKNEEKASEYFEQVKKNGCITDFVLLVYANIFEKQPEHVLNVFEQVLFSEDTAQNSNLTLCRNSPKLVGHYLMLLVELGEYEEVWSKARELIQNIMDYAKEQGEEALSVLNISPIQNTLIKCAIKQKNYKRARNIFKMIKREHRNIDIYDSMLEVFANLGDFLSAVNMIREMLAENVDPDERFIFKYLKIFLDTGDGKTALQQWTYLHKSLPHIHAKYKPNGTLRSPNKWINDPKNIMKEQYPLLQTIVKRCYNLVQFPSTKHPQIEY